MARKSPSLSSSSQTFHFRPLPPTPHGVVGRWPRASLRHYRRNLGWSRDLSRPTAGVPGQKRSRGPPHVEGNRDPPHVEGNRSLTCRGRRWPRPPRVLERLSRSVAEDPRRSPERLDGRPPEGGWRRETWGLGRVTTHSPCQSPSDRPVSVRGVRSDEGPEGCRCFPATRLSLCSLSRDPPDLQVYGRKMETPGPVHRRGETRCFLTSSGGEIPFSRGAGRDFDTKETAS